uniref:Uncharacterized protein n=1 Tax=Pyxicephalus adspersus TaxID=30357 RepID=A0AAV3AH08_PYXAD|nr:TPA: hypothetical protein GDO54_012008 [Pyxicephalus adspersus]
MVSQYSNFSILGYATFRYCTLTSESFSILTLETRKKNQFITSTNHSTILVNATAKVIDVSVLVRKPYLIFILMNKVVTETQVWSCILYFYVSFHNQSTVQLTVYIFLLYTFEIFKAEVLHL